MAKALLINGSPNEFGCTYTALCQVQKKLDEHGIETEILYLGRQALPGCMDCGACSKLGKCVYDDVVNRIAERLEEFDAIVVGAPVHYSGPSAHVCAFMDRLFFGGGMPKYKVGLAIAAVRRTGGLDVYHQLNNYMDITNFIRVPLPYWGVIYGNSGGDMVADEEGVSVMRIAGKQMAWLMKSLEHAKDTVPMPELPERKWTHFVR